MLKQLFLGMAFASMLILPCCYNLGSSGLMGTSLAAELDPAAQTNDERGVKVTVSPKKFLGRATWDFEVTLETHTQPLNDDLAKSSVLLAEGKQYLPLGWEGAPAGGHHRKGLLHFKAIVPQPKSMELQIRLLADPSPRSFKWLMK